MHSYQCLHFSSMSCISMWWVIVIDSYVLYYLMMVWCPSIVATMDCWMVSWTCQWVIKWCVLNFYIWRCYRCCLRGIGSGLRVKTLLLLIWTNSHSSMQAMQFFSFSSQVRRNQDTNNRIYGFPYVIFNLVINVGKRAFLLFCRLGQVWA